MNPVGVVGAAVWLPPGRQAPPSPDAGYDALAVATTSGPDLAVRHESSATRAVREVADRGGLAMLAFPPSVQDLHSAAATGCRLPVQATAFGPNPHPGLVLRDLPAPRSAPDPQLQTDPHLPQ